MNTIASPPIARSSWAATERIHPDQRALLAGMLLSGAIGLICWSPAEDLTGGLAWMVALPMIWMLMPSRPSALFSAIAFYLASSPTSYMAVRNYFVDWPTAYCVVVQAGFLTFLTLPWLLLPPRSESRPSVRIGGLAGAMILSAAPPIGVISAWHPLLSAGWVWPAGGWWALLLVIGCWTAVAIRPRLSTAASASCMLLAVGFPANLLYEGPGPTNLTPVDLSLPRANSYAEFASKLEQINRRLKASRPALGEVAVLPENAFEEWKEGTAAMVQFALRRRLAEGPILAGSTIKDASGTWGGVVLLSSTAAPQVLRARQPLVLSLWHPWDPVEHYSATWFTPGVLQVGQERVAIRVCSEEFPIFWMLVDRAVHGATAMAVVGNHFWSTTIMHDVVQGRHGRAAARLFGIPIIRAMNRAPEHPLAPRPQPPKPAKAPAQAATAISS